MKRFAAGSFVRLTTLAALAALLSTGCGQSSAPTASINGGQPSPRQRLAALAKRYQEAKTYQDAGELRFLVDGAPEDQYRSLPFSVALVRPTSFAYTCWTR